MQERDVDLKLYLILKELHLVGPKSKGEGLPNHLREEIARGSSGRSSENDKSNALEDSEEGSSKQ